MGWGDGGLCVWTVRGAVTGTSACSDPLRPTLIFFGQSSVDLLPRALTTLSSPMPSKSTFATQSTPGPLQNPSRKKKKNPQHVSPSPHASDAQSYASLTRHSPSRHAQPAPSCCSSVAPTRHTDPPRRVEGMFAANDGHAEGWYLMSWAGWLLTTRTMDRDVTDTDAGGLSRSRRGLIDALRLTPSLTLTLTAKYSFFYSLLNDTLMLSRDGDIERSGRF